MLNLQDNKRLTFRYKISKHEPERITLKLPVVIVPVLHMIYLLFTRRSRGQKRRAIVVCLYLLWESTPAALRGAASTLWKGGGWGCTGVSYFPFYSIYSACGWGARDVTSLEIECHSEKKRHNIPRVGWRELFCSFSSRFSFRFSKLLCALRHTTVFTTKTVIAIEYGKFEILPSKPIGKIFQFYFELTHDCISKCIS